MNDLLISMFQGALQKLVPMAQKENPTDEDVEEILKHLQALVKIFTDLKAKKSTTASASAKKVNTIPRAAPGALEENGDSGDPTDLPKHP